MSLTEGNHTPVVSISESDIAKIALTVKQLIMEEVRSIVDDKQKSILDEIRVIKEKQEIIENKYGEEIKDLKLQINTLKRRNDELEQHSRKQCIRFSGVSFTEKENTDEKVIDIAKKNLVSTFILVTFQSVTELVEAARAKLLYVFPITTLRIKY